MPSPRDDATPTPRPGSEGGLRGVVRFGPFELDAATGVLRRGAHVVPLQPQPTRVLALLVARADNVVSRTELKERIWGTETFVDFDRGLNFAIGQVRQALGDSAEVPRFVQTVPRQGYRFIAPVVPPRENGVPVAAASTPSDTPDDLAARMGRRPFRLRVALWLLGLGFVVGGAVWWSAFTVPDTGVRVAVVRFDNDTKAAADEPLVQGITDVTVARLAALGRGLDVVGNADVLQAGRAFARIDAIRSALEPDYIVVGQFQRHDDRVRVVAHLIRADDLRHLWAHPFETSARDPFGLQRELGDAIGSAIWSNLTAAEPRLGAARVKSRPSQSPTTR